MWSIAGALLVFTTCLTVFAVGAYLSSPKPKVIGPPPPDLPNSVAVAFQSSSGSFVHGWWVPGTMPHGGTVVLLHGVRANRLWMLARGRFLHAQGFGVLLIDLQAHGESPGRRITFGALEGLDAAAAIAFARSRAPQDRVGLIGVSMGGAAAVLGAVKVDAMVLESVYSEIGTALGNRLRVALGPVAGPVLTPGLTMLFQWLLPPLLGVGPRDLRPIDHIGSVGAPLLVLSGTADDHTPPEETQALFRVAKAPKRLWLVPGAAHVDLEQFGPAEYWLQVLPFLEAGLRQ